MTSDRMIYLDHMASTPCDQQVVEAMMPYWRAEFGNPHSTSHTAGWAAAKAVDQAAQAIAGLINARPRDILFTSGASEANNMALKGGCLWRAAQPDSGAAQRNHLVTFASEHKCVLQSAKALEQQGIAVTILPIEPDGGIDLAKLKSVLTPNTAMLSVMAANNEIGTIYPLRELSNLAHKVGAWFHTDAAQAFGKIKLDVEADGIDLLSISGHKIYGPKGIGALYMRGRANQTGAMKVNLIPLIDGGGQQRGLRAGTIPTPLAVGLGMAAKCAAMLMESEQAALTALRDHLLARLQAGLPNRITVNGSMDQRLAGNLHVNIQGVEANDIFASCPALAISAGSACSSAGTQASHVLDAIGVDPSIIQASLRFGLGRDTRLEQIDAAANMIIMAASTTNSASA